MAHFLKDGLKHWVGLATNPIDLLDYLSIIFLFQKRKKSRKC